jgi:hypothetical protein
MLVELPLASGRPHRVIGSPIRWPGRGVRVTTSAPALGEHTPVWKTRPNELEEER